MGGQSIDGLPSGMVLHCRLFSEGRQRRIKTIRASVPPKTIKKKIYFPTRWNYNGRLNPAVDPKAASKLSL
jgi:hypothetical protein